MGLFDWLRGATAADAPQTAEALERIIKLTNPRLRFARRYRARLTPAVHGAMQYAHALVAAVPPARDASAAAWRDDGCMRAFFGTADDLLRVFSRSPELRRWFDAHPAAQEAYVVLSMLFVERRVFGVALDHGILRSDVPQTTVCFEDHRARICGASEAVLREDIERRIVDHLALVALAKATRDETRRATLEQENALLRTRLRLLQGQGAGLTSLAGKPAPGAALDRVRADLAVNEENLRTLAAGPETLERALDCLCEVLAHAREQFCVEARRMRLDRMNVLLDEKSTAPGETLDLQVARIPVPDAPPELRPFVLARISRTALLPREALMNEVERML